MRTWLAVAGLAALGLNLAACDPSGGAKAAAAATPATRPARTDRPTTPMQMGPATASLSGSGPVRAPATAGVLAPGDLPGYSRTPIAHDPMDNSIDQDLQQCLGVKGLSFVGHDYGFAFRKGETEVDSSTAVIRSAALARATARAAAAHSSCFENLFAAELENSAVNVVQMSIKPATVDVPGADEVFAFHVVATAAGPGGYESIDAYSVDAFAGRTQATVTQIVSRGSGAALTEVRRLTALAVTRIRAAARTG